MHNQACGNMYYAQKVMLYNGFPYRHMENRVESTISAFFGALAVWDPTLGDDTKHFQVWLYYRTDDYIDIYESTMALLRIYDRFICTYFPVMVLGNVGKWFKTLRPRSILSFEKLWYFFLNDFMQLRKGKGDTNSIMVCKQKEAEPISALLTYLSRNTWKITRWYPKDDLANGRYLT